MSGEVCVVVEMLCGELKEITFTMLAAGRAVADALRTKLTALLLGQDVGRLSSQLGAADRVVCVEHPDLADFNPEAHLQALGAVFATSAPRLVVCGHTATGTDVACGLAHRYRWPMAAGCRWLSAKDGEVTFSSPTCGGKLLANGSLPEPTCIVTMMPGGCRADDGRKHTEAAAEMIAAPKWDPLRTRFGRFIEPPTTDVDIAREAVIVAVGRGIQNKDNLGLAEALARALGGVVAGSRPVVDQGWLPATRLVGKSGKQVKPKLYVAIGISGAPEHLEGVPESGMMLAINTDPKAPIFDVAHYGATCSAMGLMPVLADRLAK